ncbi:acetolactate decarboxylase [Steroidobacter agaridevorans]|uniref:acetolactate decarboxylase n=1 Tax=Steroidobacter agaridevorans TaxID=2695856 RepID=UPI00137A09AD|nr:acetolactate decarboxylase [Steroidobacter agaridevorans]
MQAVQRRFMIRSLAAASLIFAGLALAAPSETPQRVRDAADGCRSTYCAQDAIFQAVPLQGLMKGVLESPVTFALLLEHGDFGLGGTSPLDGEAIVLDGRAYQARLDGQLRPIEPTERTSVLWVKRFQPDRQIAIDAVSSLDTLTALLDGQVGSVNRMHAVRLDGHFSRVTLRSVPRQAPPYRSVSEVVKDQNVFVLENVQGTLVGYRFPAFLSGVNAPGYHFHFVDLERRRGGHVLDLASASLLAQIDTTRAITLVVPDDALFDSTDFTASPGGSDYQPALRPNFQRPAPR